jgi:hypothetical protein
MSWRLCSSNTSVRSIYPSSIVVSAHSRAGVVRWNGQRCPGNCIEDFVPTLDGPL